MKRTKKIEGQHAIYANLSAKRNNPIKLYRCNQFQVEGAFEVGNHDLIPEIAIEYLESSNIDPYFASTKP